MKPVFHPFPSQRGSQSQLLTLAGDRGSKGGMVASEALGPTLLNFLQLGAPAIRFLSFFAFSCLVGVSI